MRQSILLIIVLTSFQLFGQFSEEEKKAKFNAVSESYEFIHNQDFLQNFIRDRFPEFQKSIINSQFIFSSKFGIAESGMKKYLIEYLGAEKFKEFQNNLSIKEKSQRVSGESLNEISRENAYNQVNEWSTASLDKIPSNILALLLSYQYKDYPEDEFKRGFIQKINSLNYSNLHDFNFEITLPNSWKVEKEEKRQEGKLLILNEGGFGNLAVFLLEKNLNISKKNILSKQNEIMNEKFMKRILKTADILSFRKESFNNKPSCVVEFEDMVNEKNVRFVYHMILNNNKLNFVVFMYFKGDSNNNAFDKQRPLIKLITNNIKLK